MNPLLVLMVLWAACHLADYLPVWEPISRKACSWIEQDRPYAATGLIVGASVFWGAVVVIIALLLVAIGMAAVSLFHAAQG